jgi:hypothetical protein
MANQIITAPSFGSTWAFSRSSQPNCKEHSPLSVKCGLDPMIQLQFFAPNEINNRQMLNPAKELIGLKVLMDKTPCMCYYRMFRKRYTSLVR